MANFGGPIENLLHAFRAGARRNETIELELYPQACRDLIEAIEAMQSEADGLRFSLAREERMRVRAMERNAAKHCEEWDRIIRAMGCWDPDSYQGRKLRRIRKVRDACRAKLAKGGA